MNGPRDDRPAPAAGPVSPPEPTAAPPATAHTSGAVTDGNEQVEPPVTGERTGPPTPPSWPVYPKADPVGALSYIVSGVLVWGLLGWGAAGWLGVPALTGLGLVIGGALGTVLVYLRYGRPQSGRSSEMNPAQRPTPRVARPSAEPAPRPEEKQ